MHWTVEEMDAGPAQGRWRWRVAPRPLWSHQFVLFDRGTFKCGLGDVAPELAWEPTRKPMSCQLSSHVWDVAISRRRVPVSSSPVALFHWWRTHGTGTCS